MPLANQESKEKPVSKGHLALWEWQDHVESLALSVYLVRLAGPGSVVSRETEARLEKAEKLDCLGTQELLEKRVRKETRDGQELPEYLASQGRRDHAASKEQLGFPVRQERRVPLDHLEKLD